MHQSNTSVKTCSSGLKARNQVHRLIHFVRSNDSPWTRPSLRDSGQQPVDGAEALCGVEVPSVGDGGGRSPGA